MPDFNATPRGHELRFVGTTLTGPLTLTTDFEPGFYTAWASSTGVAGDVLVEEATTRHKFILSVADFDALFRGRPQ